MPETPNSAQNTDIYSERLTIRQCARYLRWKSTETTTPEEAAKQAAALLAHLLELPEWGEAKCPCAYVATDGEAPTGTIFSDCFSRQLAVAVPRVTQTGLELRFINSHEELQAGTFGIPEPLETAPLCPPESVDCILLPGVAFDLFGNRLGYGMGYYDKLLQHVRPEIPRVALAFDWQIFPILPTLPHDIPATHIVTPTRLIWCNGG